MLHIGVLGWSWVGTGIALPDPPRYTHPAGYTSPTPGTPPPPRYTVCMKRVLYPERNSAVGLKSVGQLSLGARISRF